MKAFALVAAVSALLLAGCGSKEPTPGITTPQPSLSGVVVDDYELGAPISSGNVTVVPVMYKNPPAQQGNEITLAEAKKLGMVEIIEIPGAEEVNRLRVHNKSDRPLLLIGGELLLGGKQDRIVVHDVIIPPGATKDVDVDCVEHGRWEGTSQHFDYSAKIVPGAVRDAAMYEDQGKVWDNVGGYNAKAGAAPASSTIQGGLNSPEVEKRVKDAMPELSKALGGNERAIGAIYVLNGQIQSMDLFGNPKTFQATRESLLHSYLAEGAVAKDERKPIASAEEFKKFIDDSLKSKRRAFQGVNGLETASGVTVQGNVMMGAGRSGTDPFLVHGSYSNKKK